MSGLGPLVDTLLATRLAQRIDLVPLKPEVQVAGPGPAGPVEEVVNDVRLPSRAAVEQQIGAGPLKSNQRGTGGTAAQPGPAVSLSSAARMLRAVLDGPVGAASRLVASEPLLAASQLLSPPAIAGALARSVGQSGLFYESHLAQFAAGTRSLAELAQEPQARLAGANLTLARVMPDGLDSTITDTLSTRQTLEGAGGRSAPPVAPATPLPGEAAAAASDPGKSGAASALPAPAGIHPEALALVRQQLELLAQPVFRWSGQAWPAVPLDWEIHREERQTAGDNAAPQRWSTRLALTLPTLGDIDVRISLAGNGLQIRLAASDSATLDRLHEARDNLPASLRESGLELTDLQIGPLAAPDAGPAPKAADGA